MKRKTSYADVAIAALSQTLNENTALAICSAELSINNNDQQLMPAGQFVTTDGQSGKPQSGYFYIDETIAQRLIAERRSIKRPLLFDYDHQTLHTSENGQIAPAAGWADNDNIYWKEGQGLYVTGVEWTDKARQMIKSKEYRYISPVFSYDKVTGNVISLKHIAITNDPAVDGMQDLVALSQSKEQTTLTTKTTNPENAMHPLLVSLLATIGITVDADEKNVDMAALKTLLDADNAKTGFAALKAKVDAHESNTTEIAALKAKVNENTTDLSQFVPISTYNGVITEMAALKAGHNKVTVDSLIDKAKDDGRFINEAEIGYLKDLGNKDLAALKSTLDARPVVEGLVGKQTQDNLPPDANDKTAIAALSAEQKKLAGQCGISPEKFAAELKKEQAGA
jgi:phage I-like protein